MTSTSEIRGSSGAPEARTASPLREELERQFDACELVRPFRRSTYDPGDRLEYSITGVVPANSGRVVAKVERFVGGDFAGQVYRVELLKIGEDDGPISGLAVGAVTPPVGTCINVASAISGLGIGSIFGID